MRIAVVANPRATATSADQRQAVLAALTRRLPTASVELEETTERGHAIVLAARAMRANVDVVLALGGDGTVNEVANGLLAAGVHPGVPVLGVLPAGSTNVVARALGMPNDAMASVDVLVERLGADRKPAITVGRAGRRWFLFSAGLGFDAAVTAAVERARRRGRAATHPLYVRTAVLQYGHLLTHAPMITMTRPDGSHVANLHFVIVSNVNPWTYLGNRPVSPNPLTTLDDGLGVYARRAIGPVSMIRGLVDVLAANRTPSGRSVLVEHDVGELTLHADRPLPLEVDGDYLGEVSDVRLHAVSRALVVLR